MKEYKVLPGQTYVGKHKVYKAGEIFPESELFGSLAVAKDGRKDQKNGEGVVLVKGKPAKIELVGGGKAGRPSEKKGDK